MLLTDSISFALVSLESKSTFLRGFGVKSHSILTVEFTAFSKSMRSASRPAFLIDRAGICVARQPAPSHPRSPTPARLRFPATSTETTVLSVPTGQVSNTYSFRCLSSTSVISKLILVARIWIWIRLITCRHYVC